ncbi:MAG: polysaccharide biosynthesis protein [Candidatus Nanoarchaeia archaeon]
MTIKKFKNNLLQNNVNLSILKEEDLLEDYLKEQNISYELKQSDLEYLNGKKVLVFGAGGTIGEEIIHHLMKTQAKELVLMDNHENSLYNIKRKLNERYSKKFPQTTCLLGDIRNKARITEVYSKYSPNIVFHYANYKSLSLGNCFPKEFVEVNVFGTKNLLDILPRSKNIERFIYISSDKAQNPSNSYGRTKRISEILIQDFARKNPSLKFGCMRYCNVLDAAGSFAIPTFIDQIINQRPITIRKMENGEIPYRYYIPISMAAKLAIKAGCESKNGEIFSLDKHRIKAIRIDELVKMIAKKLGLNNLDKWFYDNVIFTEKEKGEKKAEQLGEGVSLADSPLIRISPRSNLDYNLFGIYVNALLKSVCSKEGETLTESFLENILNSFDKYCNSD